MCSVTGKLERRNSFVLTISCGKADDVGYCAGAPAAPQLPPNQPVNRSQHPTVHKPTLLQLECFLALVAEGSFAAAAQRLNKSHPAVFAAVKSLEDGLAMSLLDRSGYRVTLSPAGERFHAEALRVVDAHADLARYADQLRSGAEPALRIVIGDLCPLEQTLARFVKFFATAPHTRATFLSEAIAGPWAKLQRGEADLAIHHLDTPTPELETLHLFDVALLPVAAPGFLPFAVTPDLQPRALRPFRQCVLSDSALDWQATAYHLLDGAPTVAVQDQAAKRALILQGFAWGHMPLHLVQDDLAAGRLVSLQGVNLPGATLPHYALRRREAKHGPVAQALWQALRLGEVLEPGLE